MIRRAARSLVCAPAAVQSLVLWRGRAPLDRRWYAEQGWAGERGQLAHYLLVGRRAGWSPHPLLEPAWVAPSSWRRPWPEPLAAPDPERGTHPVVPAGTLTVRGVRALGEDTSVSVVAGLRAAVPYRVPARSLGLRPGIDLDRALRLAGDLEDEELVRKLELRK